MKVSKRQLEQALVKNEKNFRDSIKWETTLDERERNEEASLLISRRIDYLMAIDKEWVTLTFDDFNALEGILQKPLDTPETPCIFPQNNE